MTELVVDSKRIQNIVEMAAAEGCAAVDTEFVWTKTYYPILGLIQLAVSADDVWLVDPLKLEDTTPLAELLAAANIVKVIHDASGDLVILNRLCGVMPIRIFDTRLAAGFCGLGATLSLANLLEELLGVQLEKTESRTDWTQRPLSEAQLEYAVDDVRHMGELYRTLLERLEKCGTKDWALEEMKTYETLDAYQPTPPEKAYRDVKGMGSLFPDQLAVLREVTAWREQTAREKDITRSRLLKDMTLLEIARKKPTSESELRRCRGMTRRTLKKCAAEIVECVNRGGQTPENDRPTLPPCPMNAKELKQRADAILKLIRKRARQWGVDPVIVAPRRSVNALILSRVRNAGSESHPLEKGWRAEMMNGDLEPLLNDID